MTIVRWTAVLSSLLILTAQSQYRHPVPVQRGDVLLLGRSASPGSVAADDTVRVLAARVEFQADLDPRTTGNGRFDLSTPVPSLPDAPPHDSLFFSGKLQFLSHYFQKASNGALTISGTVFPVVLSLSDSMAAYSPKGENNAPLGQLFVDAWTQAVQQAPSFPFDAYDAFVLFHAGAGRDVDLVSILGYDPTPNDIPSLYVSLETLREFLSDPSFGGVQVPGTGFAISNSLILPEFEYRILDTGLGIDTLKLATNGIAAATMGSYLGLPDLFDVTTGRSGIGQFGLMDGAGIFAYNGLFPPEPSAWEKFSLGWLQPIDVQAPHQALNVPAVGLVRSGQDTVYRVRISPREYYLIENRQRDPGGDGQRLSVLRNGAVTELHFQNDTAGFAFDDISLITGSVVDVEDLDWSMPGSTLQQGYEGGGILVWHIDEGVIEGGLATNTVNADASNRGVDLEEADGSQDIGQAYEFLQPGSGTEFGWPLDFWFDGNETPVYANRFDDASTPNSRAKSGARSLIALSAFSTRGAIMSVTVDIGSSSLRPLGAFERGIATGTASWPTLGSSGVYVNAADTLYALNRDGSSKSGASTGALVSPSPASPVAIYERSSTETILAGATDSLLTVLSLGDADADGVFETIGLTTMPLGGTASSLPVVRSGMAGYEIIVGLSNGSIVHVDSLMNVTSVASGAPTPITQFVQLPAADADSLPDVYALSDHLLVANGAAAGLPTDEAEWMLSGFVSPRGDRVVAAGRSGKRMLMWDRQLALVREWSMPEDSLRGVAVADLDGDGAKEMILVCDSELRAMNEMGSALDGFPVPAGAGNSFSSNPVVGDADGNGSPDIIVMMSSGEVRAYGAGGALLGGFPVQGFGRGTAQLGLFEGPVGTVSFLGLSQDGDLRAFETGAVAGPGAVLWSQPLADAERRNADWSTTSEPSPISGEFFPVSRVYNWPNPVYGDETRIRFYVSEDAAISVKIFDLTGLSIAELSGSASAGIDGEIVWNVRDIDSGVYLARVEASSAARTEVAVIKIAVVK